MPVRGAPGVRPGSGSSFAGGRSRRLASRSVRFGLLLLFLSLVPGPAVGGAARIDQSAGDDQRLCLSQVGELPLPADFEFVGLTASEDVGPDPAITLWSQTALLVATLSSETAASLVARVPLTDVVPLSAALAGWRDGGPIVKLFDPRDGAQWTVTGAKREMVRGTTPAGSPEAASAHRTESGWVWAQRLLDPLAILSSSVSTISSGRITASSAGAGVSPSAIRASGSCTWISQRTVPPSCSESLLSRQLESRRWCSELPKRSPERCPCPELATEC